ncbi:hypothetical protein IFR05_008078 [Cadophora sp. M221]|nr:hypothetical protein IFR05_008078 [Cadophora sp. M221]
MEEAEHVALSAFAWIGSIHRVLRKKAKAWYVEQKQFRIARMVPTNFKNRDWEISRMRNDFELKYKQHVGREVRRDLVFKRSEVGMSFVGSLSKHTRARVIEYGV